MDLEKRSIKDSIRLIVALISILSLFSFWFIELKGITV